MCAGRAALCYVGAEGVDTFAAFAFASAALARAVARALLAGRMSRGVFGALAGVGGIRESEAAGGLEELEEDWFRGGCVGESNNRGSMLLFALCVAVAWASGQSAWANVSGWRSIG